MRLTTTSLAAVVGSVVLAASAPSSSASAASFSPTNGGGTRIAATALLLGAVPTEVAGTSAGPLFGTSQSLSSSSSSYDEQEVEWDGLAIGSTSTSTSTSSADPPIVRLRGMQSAEARLLMMGGKTTSKADRHDKVPAFSTTTKSKQLSSTSVSSSKESTATNKSKKVSTSSVSSTKDSTMATKSKKVSTSSASSTKDSITTIKSKKLSYSSKSFKDADEDIIVNTGVIPVSPIDTLPTDEDEAVISPSITPANIEDSKAVGPSSSKATSTHGTTGRDAILHDGSKTAHNTKDDNTAEDEGDDLCAVECDRRLAYKRHHGHHGHHGGKGKSHSHSNKVDCCKGGVSALQLTYSGEPAILYTTDYPDLASLELTTGCANDGSATSKSKSAKKRESSRSKRNSANDGSTELMFVDCACIKESAVPCQGFYSLDVATGDDVCIASVDLTTSAAVLDVKFPMDLGFYYSVDGITANISWLHTSCSKPIYPPYAFHLGVCDDDDASSYIDLSESETTEPYLEFVDGVSARDPSVTFADCVKPAALDCDCGGDGPSGSTPPTVAPSKMPTPAPTSSLPTAGPSTSPVTSTPTMPPVTPSPVSVAPVSSVPTSASTTAPTNPPTSSPVTSAPVSSSPTAAPVSNSPTSSPMTAAPVISSPTPAPVSSSALTSSSPTEGEISGMPEAGPGPMPDDGEDEDEDENVPGGTTGESFDDSRDLFPGPAEDPCVVECYGHSSSTTKTAKSNKSTKGKCCSGGASALKIQYQGDPGTLYTSTDGLELIDGCNKRSKSAKSSDNNEESIRLVACSCVTDSAAFCHGETSRNVLKDDEICIAKVDPITGNAILEEPLPKSMAIYYSTDGVEASVSWLETSCSQAYLYATLEIDSCNSEEYDDGDDREGMPVGDDDRESIHLGDDDREGTDGKDADSDNISTGKGKASGKGKGGKGGSKGLANSIGKGKGGSKSFSDPSGTKVSYGTAGGKAGGKGKRGRSKSSSVYSSDDDSWMSGGKGKFGKGRRMKSSKRSKSSKQGSNSSSQVAEPYLVVVDGVSTEKTTTLFSDCVVDTKCDCSETAAPTSSSPTATPTSAPVTSVPTQAPESMLPTLAPTAFPTEGGTESQEIPEAGFGPTPEDGDDDDNDTAAGKGGKGGRASKGKAGFGTGSGKGKRASGSDSDDGPQLGPIPEDDDDAPKDPSKSESNEGKGGKGRSYSRDDAVSTSASNDSSPGRSDRSHHHGDKSNETKPSSPSIDDSSDAANSSRDPLPSPGGDNNDDSNDDEGDDHCAAVCAKLGHGPTNRSRDKGKSSSTAHSHSNKVDCCKGGVSALQLIYSGEPATLFTTDYPDLDSLELVGECDNDGSATSKSKSAKKMDSRSKRYFGSRFRGLKSSDSDDDTDVRIKFVDCACLDDPAVPCQGFYTLDVTTGNDVCIASVDVIIDAAVLDAKFPMDLGFYYSVDGVEASVSWLHTSCSKPIYPPYAFHLGVCGDDDASFYIDLSESEGTEPYLEFVDGVSARDPSVTFADCVEPTALDCDCDALTLPPIPVLTPSPSATTDGGDVSSGHTSTESCNDAKAWAADYCVFASAPDVPCAIGDGRRGLSILEEGNEDLLDKINASSEARYLYDALMNLLI